MKEVANGAIIPISGTIIAADELNMTVSYDSDKKIILIPLSSQKQVILVDGIKRWTDPNDGEKDVKLPKEGERIFFNLRTSWVFEEQQFA